MDWIAENLKEWWFPGGEGWELFIAQEVDSPWGRVACLWGGVPGEKLGNRDLSAVLLQCKSLRTPIEGAQGQQTPMLLTALVSLPAGHL